MKTVLITGGAGFVGAHLARACLLRGDRVIVYDLAPTLPAFVEDEDHQLTHLQSDVMDPGGLVEALVKHGATHVVHTAALLAEPESVHRPRHFLKINAEAVWQLLDIARHVPHLQRIVAVSTRSVYGHYTPDEGPITEDFMPRPVAFYGAGKAAADSILELYRKHYGLDAVSARITGVYGPGQNYSHPLSKMVDAAVGDTAFKLERGGDYLYEFTYVKDIVIALLKLLDAEHLDQAIYNVGGGRQYRLSDVAGAVSRMVPGANIHVGSGLPEEMAPRAGLSTERIRRELGFRTRWSLEEGIAEFIAWKRSGDYGPDVTGLM